ncbi:hypothetical protein LTS14_004930 [Recurvomyces mirabilis]|uniref:uncharacterized protein n=1 Tax=Recurvomyces mirabilis TaxID=574656 RepID=UPI002DE050D8|nr:hypothetical protein LTS14_004930 [Recurvomyces mirabilis]
MARGLLALLFAGVTVALKAGVPLPDTGNDVLYTLDRLAPSNREQPLTELKVTDNVGQSLIMKVHYDLALLLIGFVAVDLRREIGWSISGKYVQALQRQAAAAAPTVCCPVRTPNPEEANKILKSGSVNLVSARAGSVFMAPVIVGGQDFYLVVDSGSSDPWLVTSDFACIDSDDGTSLDQADCNFGPAYNSSRSSTYRVLPNENFNISYSDGETLTGSMGYESFTMGGINVPSQEFAVVDYAGWSGDTISSGLVGFAYMSLTSAYPGSDPHQDGEESALTYNPLFYNMFQNESVAPVFTLAINRDYNNGGVLALGGVPNIPYSPGFASTPIIPWMLNASSGAWVYQFYTIVIEGFAFSAKQNAQFNVLGLPNSRKTGLLGNGTQAIVDSGTSLVYVDNATIATPVNLAFTPPAWYDSHYNTWMVQCNAIPPLFGVAISNKIFYANPVDMILYQNETTCYSGIQGSESKLTILGDVWMKSVLCVFDIGAEMMRFAAREFSGLTPVATKKPNT